MGALEKIAADVAYIREKVEWMESVVRGMGFGGPRIRPTPELPKPPQPSAPGNPFVEWKAKGFDLLHIQSWILGRGLTPDEKRMAREAGYFKPPVEPPSTPPAGAPALGNDLGWSNGRWVFLPSQQGGADGQLSAYTVGPVPEGYAGGFIVSIGQTSQNNPDDSPEFRYWLEDASGTIVAGPHRTANSNGNVRLQVAPPGARYTFKAQNIGAGRATIQLNHS